MHRDRELHRDRRAVPGGLLLDGSDQGNLRRKLVLSEAREAANAPQNGMFFGKVAGLAARGGDFDSGSVVRDRNANQDFGSELIALVLALDGNLSLLVRT